MLPTRLGQSSGSPVADKDISGPPKAEAEQPPAASDLTPAELLRYVVDHVNETLHRSYSIVEFDGLDSTRLLQVVNDIFAHLSPSMQMDMEITPAEESIPRMLEFLIKTLGYRVPPFIQGSFPESFGKGEPTVLYPTLYWVLTHMEQNEKRVYLSRFLQPLDVPDAIRAQDDVQALFSQYQNLRTAFVQTHRRVDGLRSAFSDPVEARRRAAAMEEERDRLQGYIRAAEKKLAKVPDNEALLQASHLLREALEGEARGADEQSTQQLRLIWAETCFTKTNNRLKNLQRDAADGRVDMMIHRLKDEIQASKFKLEEQLPLENDIKGRENMELEKLLSEPLDMATLTNENKLLDDALRKLHDKVQERQKPGVDGTSLTTIKQQVERVANRKADVLNELSSLRAEDNRISVKMSQLQERLGEMSAAMRLKEGQGFNECANELRAKKAASEGMRTRLAELRAEWGVLTFTQSALQEQYNELSAQIGDLESKLGLQGYSRTVEALSKLTQEKDTIEEVKGKTLEELSRVVQDFTLAIRDGRTKLAPLINELRTVRQTAAELDQEWSELKDQYEYQEGFLKEDVQKLDTEVGKLKDETMLNESLFHRVNLQRMVLDAQRKRAEEERQFRERPDLSLDPQYKTYHDYFNDLTKLLESRTKERQTKRREVEESHSTNIQQVEWFSALKKMLEAKMKSSLSERAVGGPVDSLDKDIQSVMGGRNAHGGAGVDMLVLSDN